MARSESIDDPPSPGRNPVITKQDILSELNEAGIPLTITQLHERENIDASRRTVHSRVSDLLAAEEVEEVPYGNATAYRPTNSQVPIPDGGIVISK